MKKEIKDLIMIAEMGEANIPLLLEDAYNRGLRDGKDLAKRKSIEAIEKEK